MSGKWHFRHRWIIVARNSWGWNTIRCEVCGAEDVQP